MTQILNSTKKLLIKIKIISRFTHTHTQVALTQQIVKPRTSKGFFSDNIFPTNKWNFWIAKLEGRTKPKKKTWRRRKRQIRLNLLSSMKPSSYLLVEPFPQIPRKQNKNKLIKKYYSFLEDLHPPKSFPEVISILKMMI